MRLLLDTHAFPWFITADPFIAQAISEGIPLLSADAAFDAYAVSRQW